VVYWLEYFINVGVHLVGYLCITDMINARNMERVSALNGCHYQAVLIVVKVVISK